MTNENGNIEYGSVNISDDVLITMAGIATSTINGVSTVQTGVVGGITNLFSRKNYSKGIKIDVNDGNVVVDININVDYGLNINNLAREVQSAVKKEIESKTDFTVSVVNVHIVSFTHDDDDNENDKEKIVVNTDMNINL